MRVYTYSEARQSLASLLEQARRAGAVPLLRRQSSGFLRHSQSGSATPSMELDRLQ